MIKILVDQLKEANAQLKEANAQLKEAKAGIKKWSESYKAGNAR